MKPLFWLGIVGVLNLGVAVSRASAMVGVDVSSAKGTPNGESSQVRKSGVIGQIDLGSGTMEIGGVKYLYSPSLTRVSRKNVTSGGALNPLSLRENSHVEFLTKKEGMKERITDIWLIGEKQ